MNKKIQPNIVLTIDIYSMTDIPIIITNKSGNILEIYNIPKATNDHNTRLDVISKIKDLQKIFDIDTILIDEPFLFTKSVSRFPDYRILNNVKLAYGLKIAIEDNFFDDIKYILEIPSSAWTTKIIGINNRYAIDLYKEHIINISVDRTFLEKVKTYKCYRAVCLSQSILSTELLSYKYWVNKGKKVDEKK